ncbi:MAG: NUDIX hydrolase [Burkholderiaceae bacterium]
MRRVRRRMGLQSSAESPRPTGPVGLAGEQLQLPQFGSPPSLNDLHGRFHPWWLRDPEGQHHWMGWASPLVSSCLPASATVDWSALASWSLELREALSGQPDFAWRDEAHRMVGGDGQILWSPDGQPLGLERSLFRPLGLLAQSVQLNVLDANGSLWVARRSLSKAIDPGLWDAAVAGGLPRGEFPREAMVREAWEEAGLSPAVAEQARFCGPVRAVRLLPQQVHLERVWTFSLTVPDDWVPTPQDGEVMAVDRWSMASVWQAWREGRFNHEAAVATLACHAPFVLSASESAKTETA